MTSAAAPRSVTVQGRVLREDGTPVVGAEVLVSARRLRATEPVGETRTRDEGAYRLECRLPGAAAELVIAATLDGRTTRTVRTLAEAGEPVDLRLPGSGPSRYQCLLSAVGAHLDGVGLAQIGEDEHADGDGHELSYLSRATGHSAQEIGHAAQAARHERSTGLSAERYFGLLARGFPADLAALAQRSVSEASAALAAAAEEGVISSGDGAAEFMTALRVRELQAAEATDRATPGGVVRSVPDGVVPSRLARIFALAVPEPEARLRLYTAHLDRAGTSAGIEAGIADGTSVAPSPPSSADTSTGSSADTSAGSSAGTPAGPAAELDGHAERLDLALELGRLTGSNPPLVKALLARFDTGEFTHRRDLVRLDGRWAELVAETGGVPEPVPQPGQEYEAAAWFAQPTGLTLGRSA